MAGKVVELFLPQTCTRIGSMNERVWYWCRSDVKLVCWIKSIKGRKLRRLRKRSCEWVSASSNRLNQWTGLDRLGLGGVYASNLMQKLRMTKSTHNRFFPHVLYFPQNFSTNNNKSQFTYSLISWLNAPTHHVPLS